MERIEQMFWHPKGLMIALPVEATKHIADANGDGRTLPVLEGARLSVITENPALNNRYPTVAAGVAYMNQVDVQWRERLYGIAESMAENIRQETIAMRKWNIAIVLFGSVARRLTRNLFHPDPSNIDLAVIGQFSNEERDELFDRIRPYRKEWEPDIRNNVGVHIQHTDKLRAGDYQLTLQYIGSSGRTLYDPSGIWRNAEREALVYVYLKGAYKTTCDDFRRYKRECPDEDNISSLFQQLWDTKIQPVRDIPISDTYLQAVIERPCLLKKGRDHFMKELGTVNNPRVFAVAL